MKIKNIDQLKAKIQNLSLQTQQPSQILLRQFMIEQFLVQVSQSRYKDQFILKGGTFLVLAFGIAARSTVDIDGTLTDFDLNHENVEKMLKEILLSKNMDGITFEITSIKSIMLNEVGDGLRVTMIAYFANTRTHFYLDLSTGHPITPQAQDFTFQTCIDHETIQVKTYNFETQIAEKLDAILYRGILTSRMKDFYDITFIYLYQRDKVSLKVLKLAFKATLQSRQHTQVLLNIEQNINTILMSEQLMSLWRRYQAKFVYAQTMTLQEVSSALIYWCNAL